jgi:3-oxoacyl-[acyl-carrier-protein] synthase II
MSKRRVVITGIGLVTPLGCGEGSFVYQRLIDGMNGIKPIPFSVPTQCNVAVAATVPHGKAPGEFDESLFKAQERETSKFIRYALHASDLALKNAQIEHVSAHYGANRCGAAIGNGGIGSLSEITTTSTNLAQSYKKVSPYFVPKILVNMAAGHVSMKHGLQGPVHTVATACAAGAHSIGDAYNFIRLGYADLMLTGSADASVDPLAIAGFSRMKALCPPFDPTSNIDNLTSSRPFDQARSGFVMGEGAGVLVLEELTSAIRRNAPIIAELCGYGMSGDAYHISSPSPDGRGAMNSMSMALSDAALASNEVGYVNAHATSTPVGDAIEVEAITRVFQSTSPRAPPLFLSSTKSSTGHLLGAAGAVEAAFTAMAVKTRILPPTLHLTHLDPQCDRKEIFTHVPQKAMHYDTQQVVESGSVSVEELLKQQNESRAPLVALKNSFGFGGTNASLVIRSFP